jgi:adenylyltransferase/sulfurtransferase
MKDLKPTMLLFSAVTQPPFRTVKLRSRKHNCIACGMARPSGLLHMTDYIQFCGGSNPDWETQGLEPGDPQKRVTAKESRIAASKPIAHYSWPVQEFKAILSTNKPKKLIDVRSEVEFEICQIPGFISEFRLNPNYLVG